MYDLRQHRSHHWRGFLHRHRLVLIVRLGEFLTDTQRIARDVIVGTAGWPERLEVNKAVLAREFVSREGIQTAFPLMLTPEQFVNAINTNPGVCSRRPRRRASSPS